jgi:large subunit ribosomal protein L28
MAVEGSGQRTRPYVRLVLVAAPMTRKAPKLERIQMSGTCDTCGKKPGFGNRVSRLGRNALKRKVKKRAPRLFRPNIQTVHTVVNGNRKRLNVCTSCIKKGSHLART